MIDLDQLGSIQLPVPSEAFLRDLSSRVVPALDRRRRRRQFRNLSVAAFAIAASLVVLFLFRGPSVWPFSGVTGEISGDYQTTPIDTALESSDLVVQGLVTKVSPSQESVSVTFRVLESHPAIAEESITVSAPGRGTLDTGRQYLVLLKQGNGVYTHPDSSFGYGEYPVEDSVEGPLVRNLIPGMTNLPLTRAWEYIREAFDRTHGAVPPSAESLAPYRDTIRQGNIPQARRALEVLKQYPENGLNEAELLAAIESRHPSMRPLDNVKKTEFAVFASEVLDVLTPIASEETAQRMIDLYIEDMSELRDCSLDAPDLEVPLLRLAVKHPGPKRAERVYQLLGKEIIYRDRKGNQQGRAVLMRPQYRVLDVLAETPGEDMDEIIAAVYADPSRFHLEGEPLKHLRDAKGEVEGLRERLKQGSALSPDVRLKEDLRAAISENRGWMLTNLFLRIPFRDTSLVPIVKEADPLNFANIIQYKLPDPEFIPVLRKALDDKRVLESTLSTALYRIWSVLVACGDGEFALACARELLADANGARDEWDAFAKGNAMLFLGEFGEEADLDAIRRLGELTSPSTFWKNFGKSGSDAAKGSHFYPTPPAENAEGWLKLCSLLARTRLGDSTVPPALIARLENESAGWRIAAATALYYLENEAGDPMANLLRAHDEDSNSPSTSGTGVFQWVAIYLSSPRIDTLRLERLKNGFGRGDEDMVYDEDFLLGHGKEVISLLLNHLQSRSVGVRERARRSLESITAIQVGWEEGAPSTGNRAAIAQLRAASDALIRELQPIPAKDPRGPEVSGK
jgi:hypothetical protein